MKTESSPINTAHRVMVRYSPKASWMQNTVSGSAEIPGEPNPLLLGALNKLNAASPGSTVALTQDAWTSVKNSLSFLTPPLFREQADNSLPRREIQVLRNDGTVASRHYMTGDHDAFIAQGNTLGWYPTAQKSFTGFKEPWIAQFQDVLRQEMMSAPIQKDIWRIGIKKKDLRQMKDRQAIAESMRQDFLKKRDAARPGVTTAWERFHETDRSDHLLRQIREDKAKLDEATFNRLYPDSFSETLQRNNERRALSIEQLQQSIESHKKYLDSQRESQHTQKQNQKGATTDAILRDAILRGDTIALGAMLRRNPAWAQGASDRWNTTVVHTLIPAIRANQKLRGLTSGSTASRRKRPLPATENPTGAKGPKLRP